MPSHSASKSKATSAGDKGKQKMTVRKRVLKKGSDEDVVHEFAEKRRPK